MESGMWGPTRGLWAEGARITSANLLGSILHQQRWATRDLSPIVYIVGDTPKKELAAMLVGMASQHVPLPLLLEPTTRQ